MQVGNRALRTTGRRDGAVLVAVHLYLALLMVCGYVFRRQLLAGSDAALIHPAAVVLLALFAWSLWSWRRVTGRIFDPYGVFLIAAMLFNAGTAFLEVFHLNTTGVVVLTRTFPPEATLRVLFLVFLGIASLHCGALLSAIRLPDADARVLAPRTLFAATAGEVRFVGWVLLAVSALPSVLLLRDSVGVVLSSGYFGLFQQQYDTGLNAGPQVLAAFLVPAALFLLAGSGEFRAGRVISAVVIAANTAIQLFLGARYHALMPLIAYMLLWHCGIRPIPKRVFIAAAAAFFVIIPTIAATRDTNGPGRFSATVLLHAFSSVDNPVVATITEMGSSLYPAVHTLDLVPALRDYDRGAGYAYAALTLMPNLFWSVHPSIAHGTYSEWLAWTVNPEFAAAGGGYGFSFIPEAYINVGWFGLPLLLGLVGFVLGRLTDWAYRTASPERLAMIACVSSFLTYWARGETASIVRLLVWYSVVPYVLVRFVVYVNHRATARAVPRGA